MGEPTAEQLEYNREFLAKADRIKQRIAESNPQTIADITRMYPGLSPDVTASIVYTPLFGYSPDLAKTVRADMYGQSLASQGMTRTVGLFTRPLTAGFQDAWELGMGIPLRFATDVVQEGARGQFDPSASFNRAGTTMGAATARGLFSDDYDITAGQALTSSQLGTGFIFGRPENPLETPGAGRHFQNLMEAGATIEEAKTETELWVEERYGFDVVNYARDSQEAVRLHVTVNGVRYNTGVSPGRLAGLPLWELGVMTPNSVPSNLITGSIDVLANIFLDPLDPVFLEATRIYSASRALRPNAINTAEEAIIAHGGVKITTPEMRGPHHKPGQTTITGRTHAESAEGYVFHGGGRIPEDELFEKGGLSLSLDRSVGYAKTQKARNIDEGLDPDDAVLYIFDREELGTNLNKHIEEVGEVEQFYGDTPVLSSDDVAHVEDWVNDLQGLSDEATVLERASREYDEALAAGNSDYADALEEWKQFETASTPWLPGMPTKGRGRSWIDQPMSPMEAQITYLLPEEVQEIHKLLDDMAENFESGAEMYEAAKAELSNAQWHYANRTYGDGLIGKRGNLITSGDFGLKPKAVITIEEAEEMLGRGYVFPDGGDAMRASDKFVDEVLGIGKVGGTYHVKNAAEWLSSKSAGRFISWIQDGKVPWYVKRRKLQEAGVPVEQIQRMGEEMKKNPEVVEKYLEAWVNNRKITQKPTRPLTYKAGKDVPLSPTELGAKSQLAEPSGPWYSWRKRWSSQSASGSIDMWNPEQTFDVLVGRLETVRAHPAAIDRIVNLAWEQRGQFHGARVVFNAFLNELEVAMKAQQQSLGGKKWGYSDQQIVDIMDAYLTEQHKATAYNINLATNPIAEQDSVWRIDRTGSGESFAVMLDQPLLDSELSMSAIHIPTNRVLRRLTSRRRQLLDSLETHPLTSKARDPKGMFRTKPEIMSDATMAGWRNLQLLRPGWMMSVTPDEIGRLIAEGHVDVLTNPMFAVGIVLGRTGNTLPSGRLLDELAQLEGGLGAGQARRNLADEALDEATNANAGSWQSVEVFDSAGNISTDGAKQLARNMLIINRSDLTTVLHKFDGDVERTVENLLHNPQFAGIVDDIATGQRSGAIPDPNIRLAKIGEGDPEVARKALRTAIESLDARIHLLAGGDYYKRQFTPNMETGLAEPSGWVNSGGKVIDDYRGINPATTAPDGTGGKLWTADDMRREILRRDPEAANLYGINGTHVSKNDLRVRMMEGDGVMVNLDEIDATQTYVKIKSADPELKNLMSEGTGFKDGTIEPQVSRAMAINQRFNKGGKANLTYIIVKEPTPVGGRRNIAPSGKYELYKQPQRVAGVTEYDHIIAVDMDKIDDITGARIMEQVEGFHTYEEMLIDPDAIVGVAMRADLEKAAEELTTSGTKKRIFEEMQLDDLKDLVRHLKDEAYSPDFQPPLRVKGPSTIADDRLKEFGEGKLVNALFDMWGKSPSEFAARNPYSRVRVWETFADYYLYATPSIRAEIVAAAGKADITPTQFDKFIDRSKRLNGIGPDQLPVPAKTQLSLKQIEDVAVHTAIDDTRSLFFDLSKRGNWADAVKIIAPFADAWWEVLTRWGRLFNPVLAQEFSRPFKNVSRITRGMEGATRSGYFDTNERGERVFKWFPGGALGSHFMGAPEGVSLTNNAAVGQIGFIDFADTRSLLGPGSGIMLQSTAAAVRPLLSGTFRDVADFVAYGDYDPTETSVEGFVQTILPSYLSKLVFGITAGDYDERFASRQIDLMNTLYAADPAEYHDVATNPSTLAKLTKKAQEMSGAYTPLEILASFIAPVQPRLIIELDSIDGSGKSQTFQMVAVADDLGFLSRYMDRDEAYQTIVRWYGEDPLMVARKTYSVTHRPITKATNEFVGENDEAYKLIPYTFSAFIPAEDEHTLWGTIDPGAGGSLYGPEYQRQLKTGERYKLKPHEAFMVLSYNQGLARMDELGKQRDEALFNVELMVGKDSDLYRSYRDKDVKPWYAAAKRGIEAMYFGYSGSTGGPTGLPKRTSYNHILNETLRIGTPGSPEATVATKLNPELVGAITTLTALWTRNEQQAVRQGLDASWWYSSQAQDPMAAIIRSEFSAKIRNLVRSLSSVETQQQFEWYIDYLITPLMAGVSLEQPFIVDVDPLVIPEL